MVSVKPNWWSYVKQIVKEYPDLCEELEEVKFAHVTMRYGVVHTRTRSEIPRPVETAVLQKLSPGKQRKYEAVTKAISLTKQRYKHNSEERLKIIEMVYFSKQYTLSGAAVALPCHLNTASRWQADFLRLVAELLDLP